MTAQDILFAALGVIAAASGLLAVTTRQIVHAALWLTCSMVALSGCFLVLGAELVALVQLLVYVGAIVILVLFALMLTKQPIGKSYDHTVSTRGQITAFIVAAATSGLLFAAFWVAFGTQSAHLGAGSSVNLATHLFADFTWPFEVLSLVLLAALVGALAMVRPGNDDASSRTVTSGPRIPSGPRSPGEVAPAGTVNPPQRQMNRRALRATKGEAR